MKKRIGIILIVSALLLTCTFFSVFTHVSRTRYTLSPDCSKMLFGYTPEEFMALDQVPESSLFAGDSDIILECQKFSYIDIKGHLVIRLTKKQKEILRERHFGSIASARAKGIEISEDYTKFSYSTYDDGLYNLFSCPLFLYYDMLFLQWLNGIQSENLSIEYTILDKGTGKIVYQVDFPKNEIEFSFNKDDFSKRP